MRAQEVLKKAVRRLEGLKFEPGTLLFEEPNDIYAALVGPTENELTPHEACPLIVTKFTKLIEDADYLLRPTSIDHLVSRFVGARRRFLARLDEGPYDDNGDDTGNTEDSIENDNNDVNGKEADDNEERKTGAYLIRVLDQYISVVDSISTARATRGLRSLTAPKDLDLSERLAGGSLESMVWPPGHYVDVDIAIMGEKTVREDIFGITSRNRNDVIRYPHDQDQPTMVRHFLSWLSLTEKESDSRRALFLAPVAFLDDKERQEWYEPTGHQSRFYATVQEFLDYAHEEFEKTGTDHKSHAICLLTPWLFDAESVTKSAQARNEAVPTAWEKRCFRTGMMLVLSKAKLAGPRWNFRLVLFKPGSPTYPAAYTLSARREKHNDWIVAVLDRVDQQFQVVEGWTDGAAENHEWPLFGPWRIFGADSVEASSEIIAEIMVDPGKLPATEKKFLARGFKEMPRY